MKRFFKSVLAALPLAMLASCSTDDIAVDDGGIAKKSETRYLQVTLSSANALPSSRAIDGLDATDGDYAKGTDDENAINSLEFYFYDVNKNFHSYVSMNLENTPIPPTDINDATKPNLSGFYHCNVPVELVQGETYPQYVICIVNSVEGSSYVDKNMADAQAKVLSKFYSSTSTDKNYFGMSNSVYYGTDEVTGNPNELIMATPFKTEMLKTETELNNMTEAEKEASTINIYVERYAAKVNLDLTGSDGTGTPVEDYETGNGENVTLKFFPKGWAVNAIEKKFFFLKAFRTIASSTVSPNEGETESGYGVDFEKFENLSFLFNGWNNSEHHRCFWARTPGYYSNEYPLVADDIDKNNSNQYDVNYVTYDDCEPFNGDMKYSKYVMETTMKQSRLTGADMGDQYLPLSSIPSVLLVGQYVVNGSDTDDPVDLYAYGKVGDKYVFYTGDTDADKVGLDKIKDKMLDDQTIILQQATDENGKISYTRYNRSTIGELRSKFEIEHPSVEVRMATTGAASDQANGGGIKVAADIVVLQIKSYTDADNLWFYNSASGEYERISDANIHIANRLLLQNLGGAHLYKDGMAFFSAPIQHWGWYRTELTKPDGSKQNANPNYGKPMSEWDWTKMETGDFGIVRNHIYTLKVNGISGLGTAIKDPDDPIVPPADKVGYEVHFHVNIQKWAVLPVQEWSW